jgi:hypothetical protein
MQNIEKLETLSAAAAGLGMRQGKKLIDNLSTVLKSFKEGKSAEGSVAVRMTAMDFYLQNLRGSSPMEEI